MDIRITEHVKLKLSLVIQLIDDFSDTIVREPSVLIRTEDGIRPIRKKEGYYVFLNLQQPTAIVHITSPQFQETWETIDLCSLNSLHPMIKIRLKPGENYRFPRETTYVVGSATPGSILRIMSEEMTDCYRLLKEYEGGESICIFNPTKSDIEGKDFCIVDTKKKTKEIFHVMCQLSSEEERYSIRKELTNEYQKVSTKIYPLILLKVGEDGNFFTPIPFINKNEPVCQIQVQGEEREHRIELTYGCRNTVVI